MEEVVGVAAGVCAAYTLPVWDGLRLNDLSWLSDKRPKLCDAAAD